MKPWAAPAVHTCIVYKQVTTGMGMRASFLVLLLGFFLGSGYAQACCTPGSPCPFMQAEQIDVRHSSPSPASQNTLMVKACCCVPAQAAAVRLTLARAPFLRTLTRRPSTTLYTPPCLIRLPRPCPFEPINQTFISNGERS
ncbi:hypothetical protein EGJ52_07625 [Pseudomonas luteola]|nr:hypothetical protein EGJ52_07625 [Pseudomonas luteola]